MYAEGTRSTSAVHTPGDKGGRRYNYAIQFQADSGYAQITTHSNTHLLKGSGDLASSLEKKKSLLGSGQLLSLDPNRKPGTSLRCDSLRFY